MRFSTKILAQMKGLYQRGAVFWLRFTPYPGAAQLRISLDTDDEAEAIVKARKLKEQVSNQTREEAGLCQAEIDAFLTANKRDGLASSTRTTRMYVLQRFARETKLRSPKVATSSLIERWFADLRDRNEQTARDYLVTVKAWFGWLHASGKLLTDPSVKVKMPKKIMRRRRSFLLPDEARRLLDACVDPGLKFALYCALHAGLRKGEIVEARCGWFDLEQGLLHVQATETFETKDRDNRTVPLTQEFAAWLRTSYWPEGRPDGSEYAFRATKTKQGRYRYRADFRRAYAGLVRRTGLSVTFHDLRRTFASLLVSSGVSLYKVAKWLGDTIEVVENTYGHLIQQDDEINKAWSSPASRPDEPGRELV